MNFCSSDLGCSISADKPSADGFEVSNLIDGSSLGFVCESYMCPPVCIKIDFPVPIDIARIILQTQVGQKKTTSFQLSSNTVQLTNDKGKTCIPSANETAVSTNPNLKTENLINNSLGSWYSVSETKVILKNNFYRPCSSSPPLLDSDESSTGSCLKRAIRNTAGMMAVSSLKINLLRVSSTGPAVLKEIKVLGQPSSKCSLAQRKKIYGLWNKKCLEHSLHQKSLPNLYSSTQQETQLENHLPALSSERTIPEEFLDPLTFEIMKLPILLPSGNSIDSSSLEKFLNHEAMWGRSASDPFTAVLFKQGYKPEPHVHLKARIDRFLLVEKNLPYTVISSRGHVVTDIPTSSGESSGGTKRKDRDEPEKIDQKKMATLGTIQALNTTSNSKSDSQPVDSLASSSSHSFLSKLNSGNLSFPSRGPSLSAGPSKQGNLPPIKKTSSSNNRPQGIGRHSLVRSLGLAASSASKRHSEARALPTAKRAFPAPTSSLPDLEKYSLAGMSLSSLTCQCGNRDLVFYSLKCSHSVCSACVKSRRDVAKVFMFKCALCGETSQKDQISRIHPKSAFAVS